MGDYWHFMNGEMVPPASGSFFTTVNPSTGEVIAEVARGGKEDVESAGNAARRCFEFGG